MTHTNEDQPLSGEALLSNLSRRVADSELLNVYTLPVDYIGATLVARTLDGQAHISRAIWGESRSDISPGYFSDSNNPHVTEATGKVGSAILFGPDFTLMLDDREGRILTRRHIRYYVPLLGSDARPLVELSIVHPAD